MISSIYGLFLQRRELEQDGATAARFKSERAKAKREAQVRMRFHVKSNLILSIGGDFAGRAQYAWPLSTYIEACTHK
jgi:hypothetical protein